MAKANGDEADQLARASDKVLETVVELQDLEVERRGVDLATARAGELAAEIEAKGREVVAASHDETRLALRAQPTDRTIEEAATGEGG